MKRRVRDFSTTNQDMNTYLFVSDYDRAALVWLKDTLQRLYKAISSTFPELDGVIEDPIPIIPTHKHHFAFLLNASVIWLLTKLKFLAPEPDVPTRWWRIPHYYKNEDIGCVARWMHEALDDDLKVKRSLEEFKALNETAFEHKEHEPASKKKKLNTGEDDLTEQRNKLKLLLKKQTMLISATKKKLKREKQALKAKFQKEIKEIRRNHAPLIADLQHNIHSLIDAKEGSEAVKFCRACHNSFDMGDIVECVECSVNLCEDCRWECPEFAECDTVFCDGCKVGKFTVMKCGEESCDRNDCCYYHYKNCRCERSEW